MENSGWKDQYREAWANYRQEDQNKRTAYTHYLVTAGGMAVMLHETGPDQRGFALILCCFGILTSLICLLYLAPSWAFACSRGKVALTQDQKHGVFDFYRKQYGRPAAHSSRPTVPGQK